jgi:hypothetical protein
MLAVLATILTNFRQVQPKNSAAGEIVRLTHNNDQLILSFFLRFTIQNGKEKLSKLIDVHSFWQEIYMVLWKTNPQKSLAPVMGTHSFICYSITVTVTLSVTTVTNEHLQ